MKLATNLRSSGCGVGITGRSVATTGGGVGSPGRSVATTAAVSRLPVAVSLLPAAFGELAKN